MFPFILANQRAPKRELDPYYFFIIVVQDRARFPLSGVIVTPEQEETNARTILLQQWSTL
jgi:hypothetical protein